MGLQPDLPHQYRQPLQALSHVDIATGQVDPDVGLQCDHQRTNAASTRGSALLPTCASTRTLTPPGKAISIMPPGWGIGLGVAAVIYEADSVAGTGSPGMAITSTRANLATGRAAVPSDPSSKCRRHV
jgi:hypothetical protein